MAPRILNVEKGRTRYVAPHKFELSKKGRTRFMAPRILKF